mgnify:CR=1 FL=1
MTIVHDAAICREAGLRWRFASRPLGSLTNAFRQRAIVAVTFSERLLTTEARPIILSLSSVRVFLGHDGIL